MHGSRGRPGDGFCSCETRTAISGNVLRRRLVRRPLLYPSIRQSSLLVGGGPYTKSFMLQLLMVVCASIISQMIRHNRLAHATELPDHLLALPCAPPPLSLRHSLLTPLPPPVPALSSSNSVVAADIHLRRRVKQVSPLFGATFDRPESIIAGLRQN